MLFPTFAEVEQVIILYLCPSLSSSFWNPGMEQIRHCFLQFFAIFLNIHVIIHSQIGRHFICRINCDHLCYFSPHNHFSHYPEACTWNDLPAGASTNISSDARPVLLCYWPPRDGESSFASGRVTSSIQHYRYGSNLFFTAGIPSLLTFHL